MNKRWTFRYSEPDQVEQLRKELPIHPILCQLLVQRGIHTYAEAKQFFRPTLEELHDPFLMKGMDKAVQRIEQAVQRKEKILIYGDYDVDGTTGVALMYLFFKEHYLPKGCEIDFYIPNRYNEGYGISQQGVEWAKKNGFSLIIAIDCGIKESDKVDYGKSLGVDFIICDHHLPGTKIPNAEAVLDPKQPGCKYPYTELSGCGIAFKLVQALSQKKQISIEKLRLYLDLVVVSIASDIVPITGENRILASYGLKVLNEKPRLGLKALMDVSGLKTEDIIEATGEVVTREITIPDLVFVIGPRINAAGRMEDARDAVRMLIANTDVYAWGQADILQLRNEERIKLDTSITESAVQMLEQNPELKKRKSIVLYSSDWHKGVIGIVASRLIEKYYRPTILLTESNGMVSGSARSIAGFDIYEAIRECGDLLEKFGGHKYAAGLTLKQENVKAFMERFEEIVAARLDDELLVPELLIDATLNLGEITPTFYNILKQFAPFGPGNMRPVFLAKNVIDAGYSRIVGDNHIKFALRQNGSPIFYGIGFEMREWFGKVSSRQPFDVCFSMRENNWNGRKMVELDVKDLRFAEPSPQ